MKSKKIQLKKIVCISVSVFYPITFFAQEPVLDSVQQPDSSIISVRSPIAEYFSEEEFFSVPASSFHSIDTSLDNIQKYFPNNFPYGLGLVNRKLSYAVSPEIGFKSGLSNRDWFGYNRKETKYYRTRTPYTEVFALFGMKKEQLARLLHTQNITRQWNIAFNMLRLRSEGFYNRQTCTDNNIALSSNYTSKNNRYSLLANGNISSVKTDENGGISSEDAFEDDLFGNKKLLSVNLANARTRTGNRELTVSQFFHFGKKDTANSDSTLRYKIIPKSYLAYSFHARDNWFVYEDGNPTAGFYQNIFYDSTKTLDSVFIQSIENSIAWGYRGFCVSIKNELSRIQERQNNSAIPVLMDSTLNNSFASISFEKSFILWKVNYCFYGQNKNDFLLHAEGKLLPTKHSQLSIITKASETVPSFISQRYSSNHFYWFNDYERTFFAGGEVKYSDEKYKFSIHGSLSEIENYVFWTTETVEISPLFPTPVSLPAQSDAMIYSACAEKNFRIIKFHFNNKITWQQGTEDVIHLPQFVSEHSLYYESKWFSVKDGAASGGKKAVDVQFGFDVTYFSSYYADAYMPALGLYYLQDEKKIGNYPYIDFFFSMKIKRARIFFKTEHLNSGFTGAYYLAPNYPAPDRSFKVGIKWAFFD